MAKDYNERLTILDLGDFLCDVAQNLRAKPLRLFSVVTFLSVPGAPLLRICQVKLVLTPSGQRSPELQNN